MVVLAVAVGVASVMSWWTSWRLRDTARLLLQAQLAAEEQRVSLMSDADAHRYLQIRQRLIELRADA